MAKRSKVLECLKCHEQGGDLVESGCPSQHSFHEQCFKVMLHDSFSYSCPICKGTIRHDEFQNVDEFIKFFHEHIKFNFDEYSAEFLYRYINNFSPEWHLECVRKDPCTFESIANPTPELCRVAVEKVGYTLEYIPDEMKTPEICLSAVKKDVYMIEFVPREMRTLEICKTVVEKNGSLIGYVPKHLQTPEILNIAEEDRRKWEERRVRY